MTDRAIPCPRCNGRKVHEIHPTLPCHDCEGSGTIPDRRLATPNDRAVEAIKALCIEDMQAYENLVAGNATNIEYEHGVSRAAFTYYRIINEEAGNG